MASTPPLRRTVPIAAGLVSGTVRACARRARLATIRAPEDAKGPSRRLMPAEWLSMAEPLWRLARPRLQVAPAARPQAVMLIPGFVTHPLHMGYMARKLAEAGHRVEHWGLGFNLGPREDTLDRLEEQLAAMHLRQGSPVSLVGWSLGGVFAREVAKRRPELVSGVVTMGSPFSGTPYGNNVWRLYHLVTGHAVDAPPVEVRLHEKPPVPTVALWSPRDGMVAARCAAGLPGERDRAVALRCTHIGFSNSPEAITRVLAELDRL